MNDSKPYPIGTPGKPWDEAEVREWRASRRVQRSYADDVLSVIERLRSHFDVEQYGVLDYETRYPTFVLKSRDWDEALPVALVTGGVHGYETSGVHGALRFAEQHAADFADRANVIVVPCVSPWGYERIHRWNPDAHDPNRSFHADTPVEECATLMRLVASFRDKTLIHIDLHETTDTDETEFRPALAARDGIEYEPGEIPDGFYLCGDAENPQAAFQQAVIEAVSAVTHIAPADANGEIIGSPEVAPGVINYESDKIGMCMSITGARFKTTTEVYPDSPRATPEQCNAAQTTAARAAIDYALANA